MQRGATAVRVASNGPNLCEDECQAYGTGIRYRWANETRRAAPALPDPASAIHLAVHARRYAPAL